MSTEIDERVRRVYAAIGEAVSVDGREFTPTTRPVEGKFFEAEIDFDSGLTVEQLQNLVHTVVHNVANLKNHLKRWARRNGKDPDAVTHAVDSSLELRVIIDLSNRDKHGPLRNGDPGYSGLAPTLTRFRRALTLSPEGEGYRRSGSVTVSFPGESPAVQFDGTCVQTTADIVDKSGQAVGDVMAFLKAAVMAWEHVLAEYGLRLDPQQR